MPKLHKILVVTFSFGFVGLLFLSQFSIAVKPALATVYLARGGDDSGGSSGGDSGGSGSSGSSQSGSGSSGSSGGSGGSGSSGTSSDRGSSGGSSGQGVANNSLVDCTGPDGKHIQTSFQACSDLNKTWHNDNFSFKVLNTPAQPSAQAPVHSQGKVEKVETKTEVEQETKTETEVENEVEKPEAKEVEIQGLENELAVETKESSASPTLQAAKTKRLTLKVKSAAGEQELEVKVENKQVKLQVKGIEAEADFPLSFDKASGVLTVKTHKGLRIIRVLPDKAAEIATSSGVQTQVQKIELVENDSTSDPVILKVEGLKVGKLLGLIPVTADVTTEVGAETGNVVKVDQPFWLSLLAPFIR